MGRQVIYSCETLLVRDKEVARTKMKGKTSTNPANAHSRLTTSVSLLIANGCATVLVGGKVSGRLLNPYAMAASSMISHSCMMSGRVGGISTFTTSTLSSALTDAVSVMRSRREATSLVFSERPVQELM